VQAQRAGPQPAGSEKAYSSVWSWKKQAFIDICPTLKKQLWGAAASPDRAEMWLPGFFEAGSASLSS
jgi:hypothetical protein